MNISTLLEEEENSLSIINSYQEIGVIQVVRKPRRNRKNGVIRSMVRETRVHKSDLICPLFLQEGHQTKSEIKSMPSIYRHSLDGILFEIERMMKLGLYAFALFPVISSQLKSPGAEEAYNPQGLLPLGIFEIKKHFPEICLISDVALDGYTSHGHDGLVNDKGEILGEATVEKLIEMALAQARAGVDMVAPSDMMDGRVGAIRRSLDKEGFVNVSIHAYTAKYASALYGPYREACGSKLTFGDKRSYQMDPANQREACLEAYLDEKEGADILMVKPAIFYLDVIAKLREQTVLPISAFQVSGEYAMLRASAELGWLNFDQILAESLLSIKRAGANMIFTYGASRMAELIDSGALD